MSHHRNVHHIKATSQQTKRPLFDEPWFMVIFWSLLLIRYLQFFKMVVLIVLDILICSP